MSASKNQDKRKFIRFLPDLLVTAQVDIVHEDVGSFSPQHIALVLDEAPMGGAVA